MNLVGEKEEIKDKKKKRIKPRTKSSASFSSFSVAIGTSTTIVPGFDSSLGFCFSRLTIPSIAPATKAVSVLWFLINLTDLSNASIDISTASLKNFFIFLIFILFLVLIRILRDKKVINPESRAPGTYYTMCCDMEYSIY